MGKWTANHTDDVLHSKISALVTGAIRRSALEDPSAQPLSYNEFVNELDVGDSFTATMVDILVKPHTPQEVTERRKRTPADRCYISERTAKSLRQLTGALNIYRGRPARSWTIQRPHSHAAAFGVGIDSILSVDTDEDEFDNMMDDGNPPEGSTLSSSELFQAMQGYPLRREISRLSSSTPEDDPPPRTQSPAPPPMPSSSSRSSWGLIPATTTANTSRLPSTLRRNIRSRTSDFSDFSRRHRSSLRASLAARGEGDLAQAEPPTRTDRWAGPDHQITRRFFALSQLHNRNQARRHHPAAAHLVDSAAPDTSGDEDPSLSSFMSAAEASGLASGSRSMAGSSSGATTGWSSMAPTAAAAAPLEMYVSPRAIMMSGGGSDGGEAARPQGGGASGSLRPSPTVALVSSSSSSSSPSLAAGPSSSNGLPEDMRQSLERAVADFQARTHTPAPGARRRASEELLGGYPTPGSSEHEHLP